jgi:hypothetical protein
MRDVANDAWMAQLRQKQRLAMEPRFICPIEQHLDSHRLHGGAVHCAIDRAHPATARQPLDLEPPMDQAARR